LGDGKDTLGVSVAGTLEFGEGFSADKMNVAYRDGSVVLSFEGNATDQITVKSGGPGLTVVFADGTRQLIEWEGRNNISISSVNSAYLQN
jgi:hypothetical protein